MLLFTSRMLLLVCGFIEWQLIVSRARNAAVAAAVAAAVGSHDCSMQRLWAGGVSSNRQICTGQSLLQWDGSCC